MDGVLETLALAITTIPATMNNPGIKRIAVPVDIKTFAQSADESPGVSYEAQRSVARQRISNNTHTHTCNIIIGCLCLSAGLLFFELACGKNMSYKTFLSVW